MLIVHKDRNKFTYNVDFSGWGAFEYDLTKTLTNDAVTSERADAIRKNMRLLMRSQDQPVKHNNKHARLVHFLTGEQLGVFDAEFKTELQGSAAVALSYQRAAHRSYLAQDGRVFISCDVRKQRKVLHKPARLALRRI